MTYKKICEASLGEINRSIEKMSLTTTTTTDDATTSKSTLTATTTTQRRDSDWTVSTEGYGSMKSDQMSSRRGSAFSSLSQVRPCVSLTIFIVLVNCE